MFKKVLIANRGAIAVRIIRTLKSLNIHAIAVYHQADIDSRHVTLADEAHCLGEGQVGDTYNNQEKILFIAKNSGAEAIHPGYGFLSENPDFAELCLNNGIQFIGPTSQQMRAFALKHSARALAKTNNVPLLEGTGLLQTCEDAIQAAKKITYPVMIKSTAGGGGIGMQVCWSETELQRAFDNVKHLSGSHFSNDGVFLEKYIEKARHIEVQIFGDGKGKAIALGDRDCSAQRRHQKVVEETPAPNLSDELRTRIQQSAVCLVSAVNYANAGTVEFIVDQQAQQCYFLEVNTRLQVEHGVTECVYGVDLVAWMLKQAAGELPGLDELSKNIEPSGHAMQARLYAEDPHKNFQPSAGLLCEVRFPPPARGVRIDHWLQPGLEVSPLFDPMLAKVIAHGKDRASALITLAQTLEHSVIQGIETNKDYLQALLRSEEIQQGLIYTHSLNAFAYHPSTIDVIAPGTMTTIQDYPGRVGYWDVGVPPSGPFDSYSFRLGNRLLNNASDAAGLEITLVGPTLRFNLDTVIVLTGAGFDASLNDQSIEFWQSINIKSGDTLKIGKVKAAGARCYLLIASGLQGHQYLGSRSTFTLGQFGGFSGRALRSGDVLHLKQIASRHQPSNLPPILVPNISNHWKVRVIYGPHGAPDFFTKADIDTFFNTQWTIHYNSSRTGVRLIGPKPEWARRDGGEAGLHPSNIHDNAYAIGSIDFTGDMPVILGPDGPSLGGFVCPATVIAADLWKLGQLKAGDKVVFVPIDIAQAKQIELVQQQHVNSLAVFESPDCTPVPVESLNAVVHQIDGSDHGVKVVYRPAGDKYLLVEYGPQLLDLRLRFRVHALMEVLQQGLPPGILELTPGIRSLQIHYDSQQLSLDELLQRLQAMEAELENLDDYQVPSRIVHLPLSWDDEACKLAIEKYTQSVRKDAPWCPSNIEFIRRINGLASVDEVKKIVFDASYVVMGLGDVYLGAPVATPLDPRHRLVTTKYNPARTWTAENSVGIGGSYLCIYGMEGPGGYQFIGRTLQMWNRYRHTQAFEKPWLLRFFDQIRFYEVSAEELQDIRRDFPQGRYPIKIEETQFSLAAYQQFLDQQQQSISEFVLKRNHAFGEELQRWIDNGQLNFDSGAGEANADKAQELPEGCITIDSPVAGNVWQWRVQAGDQVNGGDVVCVVESMKMEIEITSHETGRVEKILKPTGQQISAGQQMLVLKLR
jgi:urea carboxylase